MSELNDASRVVSGDMFESLQNAFAAFQERAEKLSLAYAGMQEDFKKVNLELDSKNNELASSLAQLEETRTYLNSILESMSSGVIGIDMSGRVTQFNGAASKITGYLPSEVIGKPYTEAFVKPQENDQDNWLTSVLTTGKGHQWDEKVIWHKDGYPVPVSYQTGALRDQSGRSLGAVEIFSDISQIKAMEEEMQRTRTMAVLGEMSATVAHEIRNPLGAMGVWAGLLERDFDADDPRRKTLKKITDGLSRLNKIVSNLLVYSRPIRAELRNISLSDLLTETINFVEIEIERLEWAISVQKDWDAQSGDFTVRADPEKLQQVVMNLCLNAVQAMSGGGHLCVSIDAAVNRGEYVCFRIKDNGVGIEKTRLEKIFDPFHTTKENGTGLGLAIVKKFIDYHSGYITVDSMPDKGTTVSVFLPRSI